MIEFLIYLIIFGAVIALALGMFRLACGLFLGLVLCGSALIVAGCKCMSRLWRNIIQRIRGRAFLTLKNK